MRVAVLGGYVCRGISCFVIFFVVVTFGFAGRCVPGVGFSQKKLQKHLEVTAKVCNFALAFE
ncbi:hypothetical protein, partial [uncultured Muribaculum sp.]|uniref:hypothetical protein n=1 Tax=uncultured Muribaculum sp. TaxID=1918613 RepID=UPI0026709A7D